MVLDSHFKTVFNNVAQESCDSTREAVEETLAYHQHLHVPFCLWVCRKVGFKVSWKSQGKSDSSRCDLLSMAIFLKPMALLYVCV